MIEITKNDAPIDAAKKLIYGTRDSKYFGQMHDVDMFDVDELAEIAGYLEVYVKAQRREEVF